MLSRTEKNVSTGSDICKYQYKFSKKTNEFIRAYRLNRMAQAQEDQNIDRRSDLKLTGKLNRTAA